MSVSTASEAAGSIVRPATWDEAMEAYAERSDLVPICGGTDLMVEINFDRKRPAGLLDLSRLGELQTWDLDGDVIRLGAGVSYSRIIAELATECPGLAIAARTVGSPQIRARGTVGGNLATASPAGDAHPPLLATRSSVEVGSVRGTRLIPIDEYFIGPKRSSLAADELIRAVHVPRARGPQQFCKIGSRNAMVIATASFALSLDLDAGRVGTGVGSAGPTPFRSLEAEALAQQTLTAPGGSDSGMFAEFGRLVAAAASPIDDVRGSADYRRHALSVMASRALSWAWSARSGLPGGSA